MFGPSLKSVPGCLVLIVPMLIGVPVAFTPGLGPHDDVSVDPPLRAARTARRARARRCWRRALLLELLLLPHPARIATLTLLPVPRNRRTRGTCSNILTDLPSSSDPGLNPPRFAKRGPHTNRAASCMQDIPNLTPKKPCRTIS